MNEFVFRNNIPKEKEETSRVSVDGFRICGFNTNTEEMLRISPDGFWVRGVKIEQGPEEAKKVYEAFINFLGMHNNDKINERT